MVIFIKDTDLRPINDIPIGWGNSEKKSFKDGKAHNKTFYFHDVKILSKFPNHEEYTILESAIDSISGVHIGYKRYVNCSTMYKNYTEMTLTIKMKEKEKFYNKSQVNEIREDRIDILFDELDD